MKSTNTSRISFDHKDGSHATVNGYDMGGYGQVIYADCHYIIIKWPSHTYNPGSRYSGLKEYVPAHTTVYEVDVELTEAERNGVIEEYHQAMKIAQLHKDKGNTSKAQSLDCQAVRLRDQAREYGICRFTAYECCDWDNTRVFKPTLRVSRGRWNRTVEGCYE